MRRVIVESPFAGDVETNRRYLNDCLRDCLERGEAPFASHAIYTRDGVLNDDDPQERGRGMQAGFEWRAAAESTVVYTDLGVSIGMVAGVKHAETLGQAIEYRSLEEWRLYRAAEVAREVLDAIEDLSIADADAVLEAARQARRKITPGPTTSRDARALIARIQERPQ